ncbi:hypothetical protein OLZ32_38640 [Rhizobium sp. 1AS11]|uniref:Uncharacterized protein n=1 Tax=Rhizobium aouanii TaxID=3118145 RepID=A0ABU8CUR6_9HYPH|nr:hypothetical protein [Rhizobium acaciae]MCW1413757.1 hypothetical protein [Rhizobium acaciae]MCW1746257.1 hypothetical protein [Rhizobium acaciae]MCW1754124.1 hypothetical protein [Rhizobium acaciae]
MKYFGSDVAPDPPFCRAWRQRLGEQVPNGVGWNRVVRRDEPAAEMQAESLAACEIKHAGTRTAAKRRAVAQKLPIPHSRHRTRGEPFLIVDLAIDILHEVDIRDSPVECWMTDHSHALADARFCRQGDGACELRFAAHELDLKERDVGTRVLFDIKGLEETENQFVGIVDFFQEIDAGFHGAVRALLEDKSAAMSRPTKISLRCGQRDQLTFPYKKIG